MFMLVCVPEPVCQTDSGNSASSRPDATSAAARSIASALSAGRRPVVDARGRALDQRQRVQQLRRHALGGDGEVLDGALRLRAPEVVARDGDVAPGVVFEARFGAHAVALREGRSARLRLGRRHGAIPCCSAAAGL
jgi:hypothetical protein